MSASHASSRDDFENSSTALDALIEAAEEAPGFLGGKLSGAGWAGCTVNLVAADRADAFAEAVAEGYARRTGITPEVYVCRAADGASVAVVGPDGARPMSRRSAPAPAAGGRDRSSIRPRCAIEPGERPGDRRAAQAGQHQHPDDPVDEDLTCSVALGYQPYE